MKRINKAWNILTISGWFWCVLAITGSAVLGPVIIVGKKLDANGLMINFSFCDLTDE